MIRGKPFKKGHKINLGRKLSETTKKKISKSRNGYIMSEKQKIKLSKAGKGKISKNKGKKRPEITGENNVNWKGDSVSYIGLHAWIRKHKGKATKYKCKFCNKQAQTWANIDHKYRRNLDDFISLCYSCHCKYDKNLKIEKEKK